MKAHTVWMRTGLRGMHNEKQNMAKVLQAKSYVLRVEAAKPFLMRNLADSRCLTKGLVFRRGKGDEEGESRQVAAWLLGRGSGMSESESERGSQRLR